MPRIAKWEEKRQCIKMSPRPVKFTFENFNTIEKAYSDFEDFINQTIQQSIKQVLQYGQFASIKEVSEWEI